jgi:hypothetical protein
MVYIERVRIIGRKRGRERVERERVGREQGRGE